MSSIFKGVTSFLESVTGRNLSIVNKNTLLLIKQSYLNDSNSTPASSLGLDLKTMHTLAIQVDPTNISNNTLNAFAWLKVDPKMKWDQSKPVRFNQDNQREDDLRRLREISNCLVRFKLGNDDAGKTTSRVVTNASNTNSSTSTAAAAQTTSNTVTGLSLNSTSLNLTRSGNSSNSSGGNLIYPGGMYFRIENEWKQRIN